MEQAARALSVWFLRANDGTAPITLGTELEVVELRPWGAAMARKTATHALTQWWLERTANVRCHSTTGERRTAQQPPPGNRYTVVMANPRSRPWPSSISPSSRASSATRSRACTNSGSLDGARMSSCLGRRGWARRTWRSLWRSRPPSPGRRVRAGRRCQAPLTGAQGGSRPGLRAHVCG